MPNYCINCGNELDPEWDFCKQCGQKITAQQESQLREGLQRYRVPRKGLGKVKVTSTSYYSSKRIGMSIILVVMSFVLFFVSMFIMLLALSWPIPLAMGISIIILFACLVLGLLLIHLRELS